MYTFLRLIELCCVYINKSAGSTFCLNNPVFWGLLRFLRIVVDLLMTDSFLTKHGLFYQAPLLFSKQRVSDNLIEDVSYMLECNRESLYITAAKTGQVIGDLWFDEVDDNEVCCDRGIQIPDDVEHIKNTRTQKAKFILLVEKDSVFDILKKVKFCNNVDCIVIPGKDNCQLITLKNNLVLTNGCPSPVITIQSTFCKILPSSKYRKRNTSSLTN
ncbi:hypothetical protein ACFX19_045497 [Malus domestica]